MKNGKILIENAKDLNALFVEFDVPNKEFIKWAKSRDVTVSYSDIWKHRNVDGALSRYCRLTYICFFRHRRKK